MVMNANQSMEVFPLQHISSSEDSSSSWQTVSNSIASSQSSQLYVSNGNIPLGKVSKIEIKFVLLKNLLHCIRLVFVCSKNV